MLNVLSCLQKWLSFFNGFDDCELEKAFDFKHLEEPLDFYEVSIFKRKENEYEKAVIESWVHNYLSFGKYVIDKD